MKQKRGLISFIICISLFFCASATASERPFTGLLTYLQNQYGSPYQVIGEVKEVSKDKFLFEKDGISLYRGQELWVFDHKRGISPQLQRHVAIARVEAVFPKSVLAKVIKIKQRAIQPKDLVLTPPAPLVHLFTNVKAKHTFEPYQNLLKSLLTSGFQVKEIPGNSLTAAPGPADLILRLEVEHGHLVCQLKKGLRGPLLYTETAPLSQEVEVQFPPGQILSVTPLSQPSPRPTARPIPRRAETSESSFRRPSLKKAALPPETEFFRLPHTISRVVNCDLDGDGLRELVCLAEHALFVYHLTGQHLTEVTKYKLARDLVPIHLHAMDLDQHRGDELFVSIVEPIQVMDKDDSRLVSQILTFRENRLVPLATNMPFYLRVIRDGQGRAMALAQRRGQYEQYEGPIYQVLWDESTRSPRIDQEYGPAKSVYCIYQFNQVPNDPNRLIILELSNELHGYYRPQEKIEATSGRNYGPYEEIGYALKLEKDRYVGGFDKETSREVYAPRRFELRPEFDGQSFLIYKERLGGWIRKTTNKIFGRSQGKDQVVGVKWIGQRLIETWQSQMLAKDIIDFTFFHNPDRIMILYRDGDGYALESFH